MATGAGSGSPASRREAAVARRAHLAVLGLAEAIMALELVWLAMRGQYSSALLVAALMAAFAAPVLFRRAFELPSELQLLALLFVFATIFLGEVRRWYDAFWWWDLALHFSSGLLLGLLGFLLVYMLNEDEAVDLHMRPAFLALFAFCFAVAIGALWEIAEFAMDEVGGMSMQSPGSGDASGLDDTMWDLIVDTAGAAIVALGGWYWLAHPRRSGVDDWLRRFVARHPRLFGD